MDLLTLDGLTYKPKTLFEKYHSLIWTERYLEPGEFQLVSSYISETETALPLGSFVTVRDSFEIMMVETHSIEPNGSNGYPEITVFGRSLTSFLENRVLVPNTYSKEWLLKRPYSIEDVLALVIWNCLVNNTGEDITDIEWIWSSLQPVVIRVNDPNQSVPNLAISLGSFRPDTAGVRYWYLKEGPVSDFVQNVLNTYIYGFRAIRPVKEEQPDYVEVSFDTTQTDDRGLSIYTTMPQDEKIRFEIYQGIDRTIEQRDLEPIIFTHYNSQSVDQKRLKSIRPYKNYAIAVGDAGSVSYPIEENSDIPEIEDWLFYLDYHEGDKVWHNDQLWIAEDDPVTGEEPGVLSVPSSTTYVQYLKSDEFGANPLIIYPFDQKPESYSDEVIDESGNDYHGTWYSYGDVNEKIIQHNSIFNNGSGSLETDGTWVTVDHDLPAHDSWTISCLCEDIDGNGWHDTVIAARPFSPFSYPWWEIGTDSSRKFQAGYITEWVNRQYAKADSPFSSYSAHVLTVKYDATTYTLSLYVDTFLVKELVLTTHPIASTPAQRLQIATGTLYKATSHWVYWDSAITDEQIANAHQVALDGGIENESQPNSWVIYEEEPTPILRSDIAGFDRRILYVDGQDKMLLPEAKTELNKNGLLFMASGQISRSYVYQYEKDYSLGDLVTFYVDSKTKFTMYISEVVRTKDENGETITPGFIKYVPPLLDSGFPSYKDYTPS